MRQKSAKDMAFERERQKLNQQIRNQKSVIHNQEQQMYDIKQQLSDKDSEILVLHDWIERLLAYTELDESDMKSIIETDKSVANAAESVSNLFSAFKRFY